eukprot:4475202-Prymnesium_polylepis.1
MGGWTEASSAICTRSGLSPVAAPRFLLHHQNPAGRMRAARAEGSPCGRRTLAAGGWRGPR